MPEHATGSRAAKLERLAELSTRGEPLDWAAHRRVKIGGALRQAILSVERPGDLPLAALHALQDAIREAGDD